ncbi:hypothetical protein DFH07DRAFT_205754 [Mycena maculata]|uniref:Uncharacterized protein n=1 Tax=Mycena maculata TaxID=230809 RepID=A0AAD7P1H2_9AGAR|nr:hypothetical protein DFH07DRAFT_205754 [Mycena maculata]
MLEKVTPEVSSKDVNSPGSLWNHNRPGGSPPKHPSDGLEEDSRWIFVPADFLAKMTQDCRDELKAGGKESQVWVSEGDVLLAWWAKAVYSTNSPETRRPPLAVSIPLNIRDRLPALANRTYLHNAIHMSTHVFPTSESLAQIPLSQLALTFRRTIMLATTEEIARSLMYKTQTYYSTDDHSVLATHFPPTSEKFVLSNWLGMNWASEGWLNFRPALMDRLDTSQSFQTRRRGRGRGEIRERRTAEKTGSGKIIWADVSGASRVVTKTNGMAVRKDDNGVWVRYNLVKWRWKAGVLAEMVERQT